MPCVLQPCGRHIFCQQPSNALPLMWSQIPSRKSDHVCWPWRAEGSASTRNLQCREVTAQDSAVENSKVWGKLGSAVGVCTNSTRSILNSRDLELSVYL